MGRAKPDVRPPVAAIPSAKSIYVVEIPLVAMSVGLSAAVIGWQRGAATNVTRCRPITAAHGVLPLLREEFGLLKLILHSKLRRRAASRRALPCPSS